jgi:hypothetical protein
MFDVPLDFIKDVIEIKKISKKINGDSLSAARLSQNTSLDTGRALAVINHPEPFLEYWGDIKILIFNAYKLKILG